MDPKCEVRALLFAALLLAGKESCLQAFADLVVGVVGFAEIEVRGGGLGGRLLSLNCG